MLEYHLDLWTWLNSVQMRTPTGSKWVSNNDITRCYRWLELVSQFQWVSSSSVPVAVGGRMLVEWEPAPDRGLGPSATHGWVAQPRWGRSAAMVAWRTLGQYVCSLSPSPSHLSHKTNIDPFTTLSRIKCERYIFYKEVCLFVHWSHTLLLSMFPHIVVYVYV